MFYNGSHDRAWSGRLFALTAALCLVLAAGCNMDSDDNGIIPRFGPTVANAEFSGEWTSVGGDKFTIDKDAGTFTYDDGFGGGYSGNIAGEVKNYPVYLKSKWGYLAIQITDTNGMWTLAKDSYYVIYWKELTSGSVQQAAAYNTTLPDLTINNGRPTLEEAVLEYTVEKGYFNQPGPYAR
jgi:hypothetical protein